jgi:FKBP-type peptidyl-prolyl cis-trans isomerase FkpA
MKKLLGICVLGMLLFNCKKTGSSLNTNNQPCTYDSCAIKAPAAEIQMVKDYLTTNNITATQHCSGLFYSVETPGTGAAPTACSFIVAKYVGKLSNGNIFDQSRPGESLSIYLSQFIKGWTNGLPYIKEGGKIHLYIPPTLGYGSGEKKDQNGVTVIPANSITIFDVELISVN